MPKVRDRVEASLDRAVAGPPTIVRPRLERLVETSGADEVLATTSSYDREALAASDAALADLMIG